MRPNFKPIVIVILLLLNVQLYAQTEYNAVVAADIMNLFFIGIDNPVSIAVSGIANDKLIVSIKNGSITGSKGKYIVKVDNLNDVVIQVAAELKPGEIKVCGSSIFRVKRIPNPIPCVNGNCNANVTINKTELLKNPELTVKSMVPFELTFQIVSFTMAYSSHNTIISETATGNKLSQKMIETISNMVSGSKIYFEDIKALGPDDEVRNLNSITVILTE
jgi:gliding motility-associated protein GldM